MKLFKRLLIFVAILVCLLVVGAIYADSLAETGIERGGTWALGVETTVDSASIGFLSGTFALENLSVANPDGFGNEPFMALADGSVEVRASSLMSDTIVLHTLEIDGIDLNLVRGSDGSNYGKILESLARFEGEDTKEEDGKRFVINKIEITNVKVNVTPMADLGFAKMSLPIDRIVLNNVGTESDGGVLLAEVANQIIQSLLKNAGGLSGMPDLISGTLNNQLGQLEKIAKGELSKMTEGIGGEAGKALEGLKKVIPGLGK
ncbi:MAG: hypothetical protein CMJ83_00580 [Planctomycetes bacterium]|nr:hypothetical protein [Planctomycetota bacterium]